MDRARELGTHLGPVLSSSRRTCELDLERRSRPSSTRFRGDIRLAVEPRHASWFVEDVRRVLTERGAALCLADRRGPLTPLWRTADWTYLRFHGGRAHAAILLRRPGARAVG